MRASLLLAALISLSACAPTRLVTRPTFPTLRVGAARLDVVALTDVDTVRGVAAGGGHVFAATDRGVLVYASEGVATARRVGLAEGLPSEDVTAVAVSPDGIAVVATPAGLATVDAEGHATPAGGVPLGRVAGLLITADRTFWACGAGGLARRGASGWERVGEDTQCNAFALGPDGSVWAATNAGVLQIQPDDVIREHSVGRGIPEAYVRDVLPLPEGRAWAIFQGPGRSQLGHWDGQRWYAYTLDGFGADAVGLVRRGDDTLLVSPGHAFSIERGRGSGVSLIPLSAPESFGVRSYRARVTPAAEASVPAEAPESRAASALTDVPREHTAVQAPGFQAFDAALTVPPGTYAVYPQADGALYFADAGRGLVEVPVSGEPRVLRTHDAVPEQDLHIATDPGNRTWLVTARGDLVVLEGGRLRRAPVPDGLEVQAVATGPDGAYMLARVGHEGSTLRVFRTDGGTWDLFLERTLTLPTALVAVPFIGVDDQRHVWAALRVAREEGGEARMRGAVVLDAQSDSVVYHFLGATPGGEFGADATPLPDEITALDFAENGTWFASLSGAVRVGGSQAVVFGEARGVRGELVSDVAVAPGGGVWLCAGEGLAVYEDRTFDFNLPADVRAARPSSVAIGADGTLWAAGAHGLLYRTSEGAWSTLTTADGLPTDALRDVEVDRRGRVFVVTEDAVLLLESR